MGDVVSITKRYRRARTGRPSRRGPRGVRNVLGGIAFVLFAGTIGAASFSAGPVASAVSFTGTVGDTETASFTLCASARTQSCIIDGDTLRYEGITIRIADIDTPEVRGFACAAEKARGEAATRRLLALMNEGPFALAGYDSRDEDRYGRKLRVVTRRGDSIGMRLVAEGLAREWDGRRHPWC